MRVRNPFLDPRPNSRDRDDRPPRNEDRQRDPANDDDLRENDPREPREQRGSRNRDDRPPRDEDLLETPVRPVDGTGTVEENPDWGAAGQTLLRLGEANYADGISEMNDDLPSAREVSNAIAAQTEDEPNSFGVSDLFYVWGQFIDHDIDLTLSGGDSAPIDIPEGDEWFNPDIDMAFTRAVPVEGTGEDSPAQYANSITAFIDGSMIYGSDAETAAAIRTEDGKLLLDESGLVTFDEEGGVLAGDIRAAENAGLYSIQSLFAREHNRWVDELSEKNPDWTADELFDAARVRVEAEIQAITYNEYLPVLLGEDAIPAYDGYDSDVNPGIAIEFSTAAYRFGHSLVSAATARLEENGQSIEAGELSLRDTFFNPDAVAANGGVEPLLRGLANDVAQELDPQIVDDLRNFLFSQDGDVGLDLGSLNIQRGRDLGLPSYNDLREAVGLERAEDFSDITSDAALAEALASVYDSVDDIDAWIGGLSEDPSGGGMLGELFATIVTDQFIRIRDGDPFWSENSDLPQDLIDALWDTTLADIIERNSDVDAIQDNTMLAYDRIGGDDGDNILEGGEESDLLLGLDGDDTLIGGGGNDQLEGGEGDDLFVFDNLFGEDLIKDFNDRQDTLDFTLLELAALDEVIDAAEQVGEDVVIDFGADGILTLEDMHLRDIDSDNVLI